MQAARGHALVFVEVALGSGRHAFVDCVPIPFNLADKAALMFRKAVDDSSSEWDQHHSKRFIDASRKSLAQCIPQGFSYMHVEFGLSSGFVHVIDDERNFDRALARNVLIGLLQLPEEGMHQRGRKEAQGVQERWAAELREAYAPFDWTAALDQA
ncbi:hypothetical protein H632_c106p4 [Helicosporidium sp. ATCC 50920]|nr:hypothetical protein H632_c106p4 [Helicosporidium sp. ATCC 50920]|eukprot:KDD76785.1 hypothetical protein H632_c106p4 [Helicosporidium sp. ATCC 50920]